MAVDHRVDIGALLRLLGIEATKRGRKWTACCPAHSEKSPSWSIVDDPGAEKHGSHRCFGCGLRGGPWELAAAVWQVDLQAAGRRLREALGGGRAATGPLTNLVPLVKLVERPVRAPGVRIPPGVVFPEHVEQWRCTPALEYLRQRAADWQIEKWGIGYSLEGRLAYRIVVPVYTRGVLTTYVARAFLPNAEMRYDSGRRIEGALADQAVFGEPWLDPTKRVVVVTEGVFKAMAFERDGAPNPCAILGSELTSAKALVLARFPVIAVATDPDAAGEKAYRQILGSLGRGADRLIVRVRLQRAPDDASPAERKAALAAALDQRKGDLTPG